MFPPTVPNAPARRRVQDGGTPGWWPNGIIDRERAA